MLNTQQYQGVIVPAITPFTPDGRIDGENVCRVVDHLIAGGSDGIFVLGTTGEAASISTREKQQFVEAAVQYTKKRVPVYAGISGNCLEESILAANTYLDLGADVLVAHAPFYYALNDDEILSYFIKLADAVAGPLMLYNIPKTTGLSLTLDVIEELSRHEKIVGLKDSENSPGRLEATIERFSGRHDFAFVVGCAVLSAKAVGLGAAGIVPSSANLQPNLYKALFENARAGNRAAAEQLQERTNQLSAIYQKNRSLGQSLAALKAAMHILGLCGPTVLPPLETLQAQDIEAIKQQITAGSN